MTAPTAWEPCRTECSGLYRDLGDAMRLHVSDHGAWHAFSRSDLSTKAEGREPSAAAAVEAADRWAYEQGYERVQVEVDR